MTSMKTRRFGLAIEFVVLCLVASQPALATDPTPNWCEGVRIAAFPGGYGPGSGDRYSEAVYNGYRQAALDLGPTVTFYFSHWSPDEMIRDFKRAIDEKVDGVAFIGFGYNAAANSLIHEAFAQGTIVISTAVELPDDERAYSSEGMGYVGAPLYQSGVDVADEIVKRAELNADDGVLVWGEQTEDGEAGPYLGGIIDTLKKAGIKIIFLAVDPSAYNGDVGPSTEAFKEAQSANPGVKAVFIEQGFLTENFAVIARDFEERPRLCGRFGTVAEGSDGAQGRISRSDRRRAAVPERLFAHPQHLPDQEIRFLRSPRQSWRRLRGLERRRCRRAAGRPGHTLMFAGC